jgi:hypothetical protein
MSVEWQRLTKFRGRDCTTTYTVHPFSVYTTKSSDFSNFCGVIEHNFFLL